MTKLTPQEDYRLCTPEMIAADLEQERRDAGLPRFDWFIADNAEVPHTGVMDVGLDRVIETWPLDDDPEGELAEKRADALNSEPSGWDEG